MKTVIVAALISLATGLPQYNQYQPYQPQPRSYEGNAQILRSESDVNEGGYHFAYETQNGIRAEETGREANGIQAQGSYSYTGADGQVYQISYTAGEGGFQAQGAHIPTPPPLPAEIARALQENARDEASGIFDDGSYHEGKYAPGVVAARTYSAPAQYSANPYTAFPAFPRARLG